MTAIRKGVTAALVAFVLAGPVVAADYKLDPGHTQVLFSINHLGFSMMHGAFTKFDAKVKFDPAKPEKTTVDVSIDPKSVNTLFALRDEHLQGENYFDTAKFPAITFKSTKTEVTGPDTAKLSGNLTLRGVTKPVTLDVKTVGNGPHPFVPTANVYGFTATGKIKRSDFGWGTAQTNGPKSLGDDVELRIETEINNMPPPPPQAGK